MSGNPAIVEVQDNSEEIKKAIKELHIREKLKAVALNHYLMQKKKLDLDLEKEMKFLQKKYDKLAAPLYAKSNEIIEGARLPDEDELKEVDSYLKEEEITQKNQALNNEPINGFWFKALKNCDIIAQEIKDKDEQVLRQLKKIEFLPIENSENFSLQFYFDINEFFSNQVLKKTFILREGENPVKSDGTIIEWMEGKNVTKKTVKKKQKNKKNGMQRVVAQEVDADSFFNFFKSINLEEKDVIQKMDQEEMDRMAERMDIDYDLARMIIDEIIPYSLEYYLGVKINDEYDDIEELDAESQESILEDDEDEENKGKKKEGKKKEEQGEKQECKQQ